MFIPFWFLVLIGIFIAILLIGIVRLISRVEDLRAEIDQLEGRGASRSDREGGADDHE